MIMQTAAVNRVLGRMPRTNTGKPFAHRRRLVPANDNRATARPVVRLPNDGPAPEWRAERDAAGVATTYGSAGNRIERALVKEQSPLVIPLRRVAELLRPAKTEADNLPGIAADGGVGHERVHNQGCISPSIPALLQALSDGLRPRVIRHADGSMTRISGGHTARRGWHLVGWTDGRSRLSGIVINDGELVAYGDDQGRKRRPAYIANRATEAKPDDDSLTGRHISDQSTENGTYLKLRGQERYLSRQRPDALGPIELAPRTARAVANDNILAQARANTRVMPSVIILPDGIAADYGRLAGVTEVKGVGDGRTSAPRQAVLAEQDREDDLVASGIDADDMEIVEAILGDESFRTIGLRLGYAESSAHRMGRKAVEAALQRISEKIAA